MTGIVVVDKPAGWTSFDVAAKLRGVFHERRVGHGGTLDPYGDGRAAGVFGPRYPRGTVFRGVRGQRVHCGPAPGLADPILRIPPVRRWATHPVTAAYEQVKAAVEALVGPQMQCPPMYSAVRCNGQRLYDLARQGKTVERKARLVVIHEIELLGGAGEDYVFRVKCSKGTYVRSLCAEIGRALGCGGCMSSLRAQRSGPL